MGGGGGGVGLVLYGITGELISSSLLSLYASRGLRSDAVSMLRV